MIYLWFQEALELKFIDLHNSQHLTRIPELSEILNITKLDLRESAIEEVPSSIGCLNNLEELHLSKYTRLKRLPTGICKLKSLLNLYLDGCRSLVSLPPLLSGLSTLVWLDLSDCAVMEIPQDIDCLSSLKSLDLSQNNLDTLPASIKQLSQLRWLVLSNCKMLQSLPELPVLLQVLDANHCTRLQSLPELPSCPPLWKHYPNSSIMIIQTVQS